MPEAPSRARDNRAALTLIGVALLAALLVGVASAVFYRDPIPVSRADAGIHRLDG